MAFQYLDHFSLFQNTQMAAQVAIRQRTELFEIVERQPFGVGDQ